MINFENLFNRIKLNSDPEPVYINEEEIDVITDEIERSLLEIKEAYDIPTEEIEISLASRRELRKDREDEPR